MNTVPQNPSSLCAEVVINLPVDLCLTYLVPDHLAGQLQVGHKVLIPLGGRRVSAFVTAFPAPPPPGSARPVVKILQPVPFFKEKLVDLIRWLARYYFCPLPRSFKTALPADVRRMTLTPSLKLVRLAIPEARAAEMIRQLCRRAPLQARLLEVLAQSKAFMEEKELLHSARASATSLTSLRKKGVLESCSERRERDSWAHEEILPTEALSLIPEQEEAFQRIATGIDQERFGVFLLHGVTGSGKTEIYLQAVARVLKKGGGAIVLVPEISLTPQTGERFKSRFGGEVAIIHSALSGGERYDQWQKIASGRARVVLGPRSAVFSPVPELKLIVVDEEHETSYKQSAQSPFYHARDVAVMRAKLEGAVAVLGSATPSLESYYNHCLGKYTLLPLRERPRQVELPEVEIVDMRREAERAGKTVSFSSVLVERMRECLSEGRQVILFLNRRGFHTLIMCRKCGYTARCRQCSISLTYHKGAQRAVCHLCGYSAPPPRVCPLCHSREVLFSGLGTQRVEEQIKKFFPQARIQRMDTDTVSFRDAHRRILKQFRAGKIDILVGTQMIAKGLDYPNVTLVGVVSADTALNLADFRATEYTFQTLTQVTGRAGRGDFKGRVIIQTFSPRHPAILAAAAQRYEPFFEKEIVFRKELGYPPENHFINLTVLCRNEDKGLKVAEHLVRDLRAKIKEGNEVLGPAPPPLSRIRGFYRRQLVIKTKKVVPALAALERTMTRLGSARDLKVEVDVDPISML